MNKRPKQIQIWAEDPLDGRFLGGVTINYKREECGKSYYKNWIKRIRVCAYLVAKHIGVEGIGIRKPSIKANLFDRYLTWFEACNFKKVAKAKKGGE